MIQWTAASVHGPRLVWASDVNAERNDGLDRIVVQCARQRITLIRGEVFTGPESSELMTVDRGLIALDVTTASGAEFCLWKLGRGDVVVPLGLIKSPAFSVSYRSEETAVLSWQDIDKMTSTRAVESERMIRTATTKLLGMCVRMIHELACLPAPHRLYCELLRMAYRDSAGGTVAKFDLPTHSALAARLCTTRETISRELSFLRQNGVIARGKTGLILNPEFLLSRLASMLDLSNAVDIWQAIGVTNMR